MKAMKVVLFVLAVACGFALGWAVDVVNVTTGQGDWKYVEWTGQALPNGTASAVTSMPLFATMRALYYIPMPTLRPVDDESAVLTVDTGWKRPPSEGGGYSVFRGGEGEGEGEGEGTGFTVSTTFGGDNPLLLTKGGGDGGDAVLGYAVFRVTDCLDRLGRAARFRLVAVFEPEW